MSIRTIGVMIDPIRSGSGHDNILNGGMQGEIVTTGDRVSSADATNLTRMKYVNEYRDSTLSSADDWREKEIMQVEFVEMGQHHAVL